MEGSLIFKKSGGYRPPATLTPILSRSNKRLSCLIRNFMVGNLFDRFLGWRLDPWENTHWSWWLKSKLDGLGNAAIVVTSWRYRAGGGGCAGCAQAHPIFGTSLSKDICLLQKNSDFGTCVHTQYSMASAGPALTGAGRCHILFFFVTATIAWPNNVIGWWYNKRVNCYSVYR